MMELWNKFRDLIARNPIRRHWRAYLTLILLVGPGTWIASGKWHQDRYDTLDITIAEQKATIGAKDATIESVQSRNAETIQRLQSELDSVKDENRRFRVAAGIEQPDSNTALSVLTNLELQTKVANLVALLRDLNATAERRVRQYNERNPRDDTLSEEEALKRFEGLIAMQNEEATKINQRIGNEALNVLNELHRRIPDGNREHIIRAGIALRVADSINPGQQVRLLFLNEMGGYTLAMLPTLANELEALSKLLPPALTEEQKQLFREIANLRQSPNLSSDLVLSSGEDLSNRTVPLDGRHYKDCIINNTVFLYDGGEYKLESCDRPGPTRLATTNQAIVRFLSLARSAGFLPDDTYDVSRLTESQLQELQHLESETP